VCAQSVLAGEAIHITRAAGPITIDGDLSDEGWRNATRVDKWYEINPGDNTEPAAKNVGYLTYDDRFFYAAFEFEEPTPSAIRAPLGDHDNIDGNGQAGHSRAYSATSSLLLFEPFCVCTAVCFHHRM